MIGIGKVKTAKAGQNYWKIMGTNFSPLPNFQKREY